MDFGFKQGTATIANRIPGEYLWDVSVIKAEGKYWMFNSHWPSSRGFGWNWLFISHIFLSVSDKPEGPYKYVKEILPIRDKNYFDGLNTHNPHIRYFNGKFYLYYMGCTYNFETPKTADDITMQMIIPTWNAKRIGLAIADKIDGEYIRQDKPILEPRREGNYWDSAITANPTVVIKDSGETLMIYKSALYEPNDRKAPLRIGVAIAKNPTGPFERYLDEPILTKENPEYELEDPCLWYDEKKKKYCALIKDCVGNITGDWGNLLYAESDDCKTFKIADDPTAIIRTVKYPDGTIKKQCNLERPFVLFDEEGNPAYLFAASGDGKSPFNFEGETYTLCIKLEKK